MRRIRLATSALLLVAGTLAAMAHAKMVASTPADGVTVPGGMSEIAMQFSHPMRLTLVKVQRVADHATLPLKGPLPKDYAGAAKVSVDPLTPGVYDVSWTAVSEDGHVMKGHFGFTVEAGRDAPAQ